MVSKMGMTIYECILKTVAQGPRLCVEGSVALASYMGTSSCLILFLFQSSSSRCSRLGSEQEDGTPFSVSLPLIL